MNIADIQTTRSLHMAVWPDGTPELALEWLPEGRDLWSVPFPTAELAALSTKLQADLRRRLGKE